MMSKQHHFLLMSLVKRNIFENMESEKLILIQGNSGFSGIKVLDETLFTNQIVPIQQLSKSEEDYLHILFERMKTNRHPELAIKTIINGSTHPDTACLFDKE